jgi:Ca2+-binding RTX toxin-like protein
MLFTNLTAIEFINTNSLDLITDNSSMLNTIGFDNNDDLNDDLFHGGDNLFHGGIGFVDYAYNQIEGTENDDLINGTSQRDYIQGFAGNDTLIGGSGDDTIDGGDGSDSLLGGQGDELFHGGIGTDIIDGGVGFDTVDYNYVDNGQYPVRLIIGLGSETVNCVSKYWKDLPGVNGVDKVYNVEKFIGVEGENNNLLIRNNHVSSANVNLSLGTITSYSPDIIDHYVIENFQTVVGGDGDDTITGNQNDNVLSGHYGNDIISGGDGDDTLSGSFGTEFSTQETDILIGGKGSDTFDFSYGMYTYYGDDTQAIIQDFETGVDIIQFGPIEYGITQENYFLSQGSSYTEIYYKSDPTSTNQGKLVATVHGSVSESDLVFI